jgi:hypothetical protein
MQNTKHSQFNPNIATSFRNFKTVESSMLRGEATPPKCYDLFIISYTNLTFSLLKHQFYRFFLYFCTILNRYVNGIY